MCYLIQPTSDRLNRTVKQNVNEVADEKNKSKFKSYSDSSAYRIWFVDKMKQDIDLCENTKVLAFVFQKGISLDTIDQQSLALIKSMVFEK